MEKECRNCKLKQPLDAFYKHSEMADGHLNICKMCKKEYQRRRAKTPEGKAVERRRNQNPERKKYTAENSRKWRESNPEKYRAHTLVNNAVRDGRLDKPDTCERCGDVAGILHGHHADYSKPLEVNWLCAYCHGDENPNTIHQLSLTALVNEEACYE